MGQHGALEVVLFVVVVAVVHMVELKVVLSVARVRVGPADLQRSIKKVKIESVTPDMICTCLIATL